jgi:hypothetical protein
MLGLDAQVLLHHGGVLLEIGFHAAREDRTMSAILRRTGAPVRSGGSLPDKTTSDW